MILNFHAIPPLYIGLNCTYLAFEYTWINENLGQLCVQQLYFKIWHNDSSNTDEVGLIWLLYQ